MIDLSGALYVAVAIALAAIPIWVQLKRIADVLEDILKKRRKDL